MTEKRTIQQMLEDFRKDFGLNFAQVAIIAKPESPGYKERVEKMDKVREIMKSFVKLEAMHKWLFLHGENNFFNEMVKGNFDKVIDDLSKLKRTTLYLKEDTP